MKRPTPTQLALAAALVAVLMVFLLARRDCDDVCAERGMVWSGDGCVAACKCEPGRGERP